MNPIDALLRTEIRKGNTPSAQYLFFDADTIIHQFQEGYANIAQHEKLNDKTTYNGFSLTKTFTALAILQLQEQGKLSLDQSVKELWSDFPYSSSITIRHLLTHTAGIPNPLPLSWVHVIEETATFDAHAFFDKIFRKHHKTNTLPNERFRYSNLGYVCLGRLIEEVSGLSYQDYIRAHIISVLGLEESELGFTIDPEHHASGYHLQWSLSNLILGLMLDKKRLMGKAQQGWKPFHHVYVNGAAYGGLIGTASAFMTYLQALLRPHDLLTEASKTSLFTEAITSSGQATDMCLSWFKGQTNDINYYTHAGGGGGYYTELRIYPEIGKGSVLIFNRSGMTDVRFLNKLDSYMINQKSSAMIS